MKKQNVALLLLDLRLGYYKSFELWTIKLSSQFFWLSRFCFFIDCFSHSSFDAGITLVNSPQNWNPAYIGVENTTVNEQNRMFINNKNNTTQSTMFFCITTTLKTRACNADLILLSRENMWLIFRPCADKRWRSLPHLNSWQLQSDKDPTSPSPAI